MIKELFTAIDERNARAFAEYLTDDCIFRFGNQNPVVGKVEVEQHVAAFFDSIQRIEHRIEEQWTVEGVIVCQGTVTYTRLDGSQLSVPFANLLKMVGGQIREYLIFVDASDLYAE